MKKLDGLSYCTKPYITGRNAFYERGARKNPWTNTSRERWLQWERGYIDAKIEFISERAA